MRLLFDIAALLAAIVLGYLLYLLLFERRIPSTQRRAWRERLLATLDRVIERHH